MRLYQSLYGFGTRLDKESGKYWSNPDGLSKVQLISCMEYEMTQVEVEELHELFCLDHLAGRKKVERNIKTNEGGTEPMLFLS